MPLRAVTIATGQPTLTAAEPPDDVIHTWPRITVKVHTNGDSRYPSAGGLSGAGGAEPTVPCPQWATAAATRRPGFRRVGIDGQDAGSVSQSELRAVQWGRCVL
ncbi:hypothetical protein FZI93_06925 [Mycobacterium sp. CBMA361]|uniref:hypothetical protein n=1 Tax=Mycolicibacterium sp. CBMA 213 TaxID=1968788 RepID=UPI0013A8E81A|nr:hypothetical protein [Mycolicibacterium sp. CBMA 213]MUM05933.1 hypothetical protein [Mycolicibacterium sp. CBMA 213]MUM31585.1 hypothetical protein [Mycolicibacterium sp. CBMA 361]